MNNNKNSVAVTVIYIVLSFIFGFAYGIIKLNNAGWLTLLLFPVFIVYALLYVAASVCNGLTVNRSVLDHIRYWLLTIIFLISGLTFVDFNDVDSAKLIHGVSENTLEITTLITMGITVVLSIVSYITCIVKFVTSTAKDSNTKEKQDISQIYDDQNNQ